MTESVRKGYHTGPHRRTLSNPWRLTRGEWRVVAAICAGATTHGELSKVLRVNVRTVQTHLCSIYEKTGVPNMSALILRVLANGEARERAWTGLKIENK